MNGPRHAGRARGEDVVDEADVAARERVRDLAARANPGPHRLVAVAGQRRVVELERRAAERGEILELGPVDGDEVGVVLLDVRVHVGIDAPRPEKEVHDVGGGNRHLGHADGHDAVEESELVDGDPPRPAEAGPSVRRRQDAARPLLVPEAERRLAEPEPVDGVDEPRRPAPAPELAVGHGPESEPLLKGDHLADALVLELAEPLGGEPAGSGVARGAEQAIGLEEAPDMLGAS